MTLLQLRTLLRRRLQEALADQWQDVDLNGLLLQGLRDVQMDILAVDPDAFVSMYRGDIVSATSDPERLRVYSWPDGTLYELAVKYKAAGATKYAKVGRTSYGAILRGRSSSSELKYAHFGNGFFVLDPPPSAAIAAGLQVEVVETLSVSADTDVPEIPIPLHEAIVYYAHLAAIQETGEPTAQIRQELKAVLEQIPDFYQNAGAQDPSYVEPGVSKGY